MLVEVEGGMMNEYIAWTIFTDDDCENEVRRTERHGEDARYFMRVFRDLKGSGLREGDVIYGCRIDKIGEVETGQ